MDVWHWLIYNYSKEHLLWVAYTLWSMQVLGRAADTTRRRPLYLCNKLHFVGIGTHKRSLDFPFTLGIDISLEDIMEGSILSIVAEQSTLHVESR